MSRLCSEDDTASHAKVCPFMETKWTKECEDDLEKRADFFVKLNRERRDKYGYPIL